MPPTTLGATSRRACSRGAPMGNYGCLLDGTSNISLTGKIAHFELGYIPESAKLLRAVAGFLITNYTRQHIITMPRRLRKRNVYEEVARLLDMPGGEQIVQESYAQMRKFNCWNMSRFRRYGRFKESRIRSAVFGNSRQFFLIRACWSWLQRTASTWLTRNQMA